MKILLDICFLECFLTCCFVIAATVVATQLNSLITSGDLDDLSVIRLDRFICNTISPER